MDERVLVDNELFLGRLEEQIRFRALLDNLMSRPSWNILQPRSPCPPEWSYVVLLYGEGGMGKTTLSKRLRDIAQGVGNASRYRNQFEVLWIDWEAYRDQDPRLAARDAVSFETVLDYLYTEFRDAGFGDEFDDFEKVRARRTDVEKHVEQELNTQTEGQDRLAPLRKLGAAGLAALLRGTHPDLAQHFSQPQTEAAFEAVLNVTAQGLVQLKTTGEELLRRRLEPEEYNLFVLPHETLAHTFAKGVRDTSSDKPVIVFLDTYEIIDRIDAWLRGIIRQSGRRVLWVLSGRDNLAETRRYGRSHFVGYQGQVPADRLRVFRLSEFSQDDVMAYFAETAPGRNMSSGEASAIHGATLGIPLAVKVASALWARGASMKSITEGLPGRGNREEIVGKMTERFLVHAHTDPDHPEDVDHLYALALAHSFDYELLTALLNVQEVRPILDDLERRYGFVEAYKMRLHDTVRDFIREYLLAEVERKSPIVRAANERAVAMLEKRLEDRNRWLPTLEARLDDSRWKADALALTWHRFWLDEDTGWSTLLSLLLPSITYDRDFTRVLLDTVDFFQSTWSEDERSVLSSLRASLSPDSIILEQMVLADVWYESLSIDVPQPDAGCEREQAAIWAYWKAQQALALGRSEQAQTLLEEVLREAPKEAHKFRRMLSRGFINLTYAYIPTRLAETDKALRHSLKAAKLATQLNPKNDAAWQRLGWLYWRSNQSKLAIPALEQAISLRPRKAYHWHTLGHVYADAGRFDEAFKAFQKAIEFDPESADHWACLGHLNRRRKQIEEADEAFQEALNREPDHAAAWSGLGDINLYKKNVEEAITAYEKAIELDPELPHAWLGLGEAASIQGEVEKAVVALERATKLSPKWAKCWLALGDAYSKQGQFEKAVHALQCGVELDPKHAGFYGALGDALLAAGDLEKAITVYKKAVELDPKLAVAWSRLGDIYLAKGESKEAIAAFERATRSDSKLIHAWHSLGAAYLAEQQLDKAIRACRRAVDIDPSKTSLWEHLGYLYLLNNNLPEAEHALGKAINLGSSSEYVPFVNLAILQFKQGKLEASLDMLRQAMEACTSGDIWSRLTYSWLWVLLGEEERGLAELRKVLLDPEVSQEEVLRYIENTELLASTFDILSGSRAVRAVLLEAAHVDTHQ